MFSRFIFVLSVLAVISMARKSAPNNGYQNQNQQANRGGRQPHPDPNHPSNKQGQQEGNPVPNNRGPPPPKKEEEAPGIVPFSKNSQAQMEAEQMRDVVILSLALNWQDLWDQNASFEQVPEHQRHNIVTGVLVEIATRVERYYHISDMKTFEIKKVQQNLALVEYPMLSGRSEIDLNLLANHLLDLGKIVMNVNIFLNNHPLTIIDLGAHGDGHGEHGGHVHGHNHDHGHHGHSHEHQGIVEGSHGQHVHDPRQHYYQQNTRGIDDKIRQVQESLKTFDLQLDRFHEENQKIIADYEKENDQVEGEYHGLLETLEKETLAKFKTMEDGFHEHTVTLQQKYDAAMFDRQDAETEHDRLAAILQEQIWTKSGEAQK